MADLTPHQRPINDERLHQALAGTIIVWAKAVRRIYRQIVIRDREVFPRILLLEDHIMLAHLLVLGLRQIAEHLEKMKRVRPGYRTQRFSNAARAFLREYQQEDIRTCRHLLEHHADHLMGRGKYQDAVEEIDLYMLALQGTRQDDEQTIAFSIGIFGRGYQMDRIVRCVDELLAAFDDPGPQQADIIESA
jgi:hypothetical protein